MTQDPDFAPATVAGCRALTGKHPADLIAIVAELGVALGELEALFHTIADVSDIDRPANTRVAQLMRIRRLARVGFRVTLDLADYASGESDDLRAALLSTEAEKAA